jgi:hypothetical protein
VVREHQWQNLLTLDPFLPDDKKEVTVRTCNLKNIRVRAYSVDPSMLRAFRDYATAMSRWYRDKNNKKSRPVPPGQLVEDVTIPVGTVGIDEFRPDFEVTTHLRMEPYLRAARASRLAWVQKQDLVREVFLSIFIVCDVDNDLSVAGGRPWLTIVTCLGECTARRVVIGRSERCCS